MEKLTIGNEIIYYKVLGMFSERIKQLNENLRSRASKTVNTKLSEATRLKNKFIKMFNVYEF